MCVCVSEIEGEHACLKYHMQSTGWLNLTSTPPLSLRACDTTAIPLAVACALARIASASPEQNMA